MTTENNKKKIPLLSCPFCGQNDAIYASHPKIGQHYIFCMCCEAQGPLSQSRFGAGLQWNGLALPRSFENAGN